MVSDIVANKHRSSKLTFSRPKRISLGRVRSVASEIMTTLQQEHRDKKGLHFGGNAAMF